MPEAPELEVVKDFLNARVKGVAVVSAKVIKPSVLRPLAGDLVTDVAGRTIERLYRHGKFLVAVLSGDRLLAANFMLTGSYQYSDPSDRVFKKCCFILSLSNEREIRYLDGRQMGRVYYVTEAQLGQVPQYRGLGPDVLDTTSFEDFKKQLAPFHGEIKGVLTRGRVISGVGNAYADEILYAACIYPFRKARSLSDDELRRLYECSHAVMEHAIEEVRGRMGDDIHMKFRDFLQVHRRGGTPCPRCGGNISEITANQRITSYCRSCQPGMLIKR